MMRLQVLTLVELMYTDLVRLLRARIDLAMINLPGIQETPLATTKPHVPVEVVVVALDIAVVVDLEELLTATSCRPTVPLLQN
jgi:hypothetical protein